MTRILEYLEIVTVDGKEVNRCRKCQHVLGHAADDFKRQAGSYDEPISKGQPEGFAEPDGIDWVLRHFICPQCGVLLEVDMLPKGEQSQTSAQLDGTLA